MILDLPLRIAAYTTPETAFENLSQFVYDLREQLDTILENLEQPGQTTAPGENALSGETLHLDGKNGAYFEVGKEKEGGCLSFEIVNDRGRKLIFMSGSNLIIDKDVVMHIDGGIWG